MNQAVCSVDLREEYVVVWRILEACDLDCPFCNYRRSNHYCRSRFSFADVTRFSDILAHWATDQNRRLLISWLGGEPFLWSHLLDASTRLRRSGARVSATTNGRILATPAHSSGDVASSLDELTISIDGLGLQHDQSRQTPGLYNAILSKLEDIHKASISLGKPLTMRINILLSKRSISDFRVIINDFVDVGVTEATFNALWLPAAHRLAKLQLDSDDIRLFSKQLPSVREDLRGKCAVLGTSKYLRRLAHYAAGIAVPVDDCYPGAATLFVESNGKLSPCAYTTAEYGADVRNITSVADLHAVIRGFHAQRQTNLASACHDCPDTNVFGKFQSDGQY